MPDPGPIVQRAPGAYHAAVAVKFCGLTRPEDAAIAASLGAAYAGVIFAGGPRLLTPARAREVLAAASGARKVGVFGAQDAARIGEVAREVGLDVVQLHGDPDTNAVDEVRRHFAGEVWAVVRCEGDRVPSQTAALFCSADAQHGAGARRRADARQRGRGGAGARARGGGCVVGRGGLARREGSRAHARLPARRNGWRRMTTQQMQEPAGPVAGTAEDSAANLPANLEDTDRFGPFGGRYVPETLVPALDELEAAYATAQRDPAFRAELSALLTDYVGRPA